MRIPVKTVKNCFGVDVSGHIVRKGLTPEVYIIRVKVENPLYTTRHRKLGLQFAEKYINRTVDYWNFQ